jgi:thioesterase domain-containing protein
MAQQLHAQGQQVALLTMIDTPGQGYMPPAELKTDAEIIAYLFKVDMNVSVSLDELRKLEPDEQLRYFMEEQKKMNTQMFPDLDITAFRHFFHLFKRDVQAMLDYQPQVYPGRIIFFRAKETTAYNPQAPERAWIDLALEGTEVHIVPGNHITMNESPHVQVIAERLRAYLEKAPMESK